MGQEEIDDMLCCTFKGFHKQIVRMNKSLLGCFLILVVYSCQSPWSIINRPIIFNEERIQLTREYLQTRYGLKGESIIIEPKMIVLHHTVIPTLEKTFEVFDPATLPNWRPEIGKASGLNVSSQFVVDRDGKVYQLMPENHMARHVIGLNHCAIGVENVGGTPELP